MQYKHIGESERRKGKEKGKGEGGGEGVLLQVEKEEMVKERLDLIKRLRNQQRIKRITARLEINTNHKKGMRKRQA